MSAEIDHLPNQPAEVPDRFRNALQAAEVGLWQWDPRTGAVDLSQAALTLLRRSRMQTDSYAGFIDAFHPDDRVPAEQALHHSVASQEPFDFDVRSAESGRWVRVRGKASDQQVAGILIPKGVRTPTETMKSRLAAIVASSGAAIIR